MANDAPLLSPTGEDRRTPMQRVRVGVTGLAAVILFMVLATAFATVVRRNAAAERMGVPLVNAAAPAGNSIDPNAEPLAQLGVAPGATGKSVEAQPAKQK